VASVATLPVRSCLIDGETIVSDEAGLAVFELIRSRRHDHAAVLCAFDLLELDGENLRRLPIEVRKAGFAQLLRGRIRASRLTRTTSTTAISSTGRPASSAARASRRSSSARS
jgi:ATP-dependent DNA ligase